ncbi:GmrSD restriction endonuclease domain-containing protein [Arcanobacterium phocae]|uniref:GmrSD restriction endonuclease domain-containing protein n=1 Tax=Arcanobacterium phocae TaxID=131112 RepID=UPI00344FFA71
MMLSALAYKFEEIDSQEIASATFSYVRHKNDYGELVPRIQTKTSHPFFYAYVQSLGAPADIQPSTDEETNIKLTYDFFTKELDESRLRERDRFKELDIPYEDLLLRIRDQILKMRVISIVTEDKGIAYKVFEILNAKGKQLASVDLIKNSVLEPFHNDEKGMDEQLYAQWESLKSILRKRDSEIGFVTFYRHYWLSKYNKCSNRQLYDNFKTKFLKGSTQQKKDKLIAFVTDLCTEAETYIKIVHPLLEDFNNRKEYNWAVQSLNNIENIFGVTQARIASMALIDVKSRDLISHKSFKRAIHFIENFIFVYSALLKKQANIYESRFSTFAIKLRKSTSKNETEQIINDHLFAAFADKIPNEEAFLSGFIALKYSKRSRPTNMLTKYVLNKLSISFTNGRDHFWDDASVEHIINESPNDECTLLIGNLICLEKALNQKADNLTFDEKLTVYQGSKYDEVIKLCNEYHEFDSKSIEKRSIALGEYYYKKIIKPALLL